MANINLSSAVRSNLSSLQNTASLMSKTSDRLSSGNKVNSALDNPTNFFTASSLNSRAGDLNNLMDSMANGIKTIEAADNGLTAITKNLESMQSTLRQARQDKSFQTSSLTMDLPATADLVGDEALSLSGGQFGDTASSISLTKTDYKATVTATYAQDDAVFSLNGKQIEFVAADDLEDQIAKVNDANAGVVATKNTAGTQLILTSASTSGTIAIDGIAAGEAVGLSNGTTAKVAATVTAGTAYSATAAKTFSINDKLIELGAGEDLDAAMEAINTSGAGVTATRGAGADNTVTTDDVLILTANDKNTAVKLGSGGTALGFSAGQVAAANGPTGAASTVVAKSVSELVSEINSGTSFQGKIRASNDNGTLRIENLSTTALDISGASASGKITGDATAATSIGGNAVRTDLSKQFNELRDQLDKLSDDASFNGINLLRGDNLKITFNETGTSSIEIQTKGGESLNAAMLNLDDIEAGNLDTDGSIDGLLDTLKGALNMVRSQASTFGSNLSVVQNRQDFTKSMINTLETGAGNLTLADMNQEAANMMALQTRQSLASSTLSMANQADQGVLQLLR